jgi:hypothetical protein
MYRYVEKLIRPPGIALLVGSGSHKGFEIAMRQKIDTFENLPPNDVRDAAVAGFDERFAESGALLTNEEESKGTATVVGESRDRVAAIAHFWAVLCQPNYQPTEVEKAILIPCEAQIGRNIIGFVDMLTPEVVVDWKTGKKKLSHRDVESSVQLATYTLWHHREYGGYPTAVIEQIAEGSQTTAVCRTVKHTKEDHRRLLLRAQCIIRTIEAGNFPPCDPGSWWCSRKFCGYSSECPYYVPELEEKKHG